MLRSPVVGYAVLPRLTAILSTNHAKCPALGSPTGNRNTPIRIQVATLIPTFGEKYPYLKPYPYEKKKFTMFNELFEYTTDRFNDNTRVVVVEGNVAVGKNEFARRLAKNFDLKVYPAIQHGDAFLNEKTGYDWRQLNHLLPDRIKFYDLERFYTDPHPEVGLIGKTQIMLYMQKYWQYCEALTHLHNTGQGVVLVRNAYSDMVYAETLRDQGYITSNMHKYLHKLYDYNLIELLPPHLHIYLDAPISTIRDRIKARNLPYEINSKVLSDDFLHNLDKNYRNKYLAKYRQTSEILEVDWSQVANDMDMEVLVEEIGHIYLDSGTKDEPKFKEWCNEHEDTWSARRRMYASETFRRLMFQVPEPIECPEFAIPPEYQDRFDAIVTHHPLLTPDPVNHPSLGGNPYTKLFV